MASRKLGLMRRLRSARTATASSCVVGSWTGAKEIPPEAWRLAEGMELSWDRAATAAPRARSHASQHASPSLYDNVPTVWTSALALLDLLAFPNASSTIA